ncbi:MAG: GerMN domain-containing protein [Cyanobacteria bacterium J06633_8]
MNKIIRRNQKYISPLMLSAMAIAISSCGSDSTVNNLEESPSNQSPVADNPLTTRKRALETPEIEISTKPSPKTKAAPFGTTTPSSQTLNRNKTGNLKNSNITVYTSDLQCQKLVPQKVSVSANEPMKDAVGRIIASKNTADLNIANYRVNFNKGTATVDFRLSPNSRRQLVSLSSCEQFTLFQSIQKTLTSNPKWNVKNVRFTQSGKEIYL